MPRVEWTGRNMRYMMCAFPLVGLAIALACALYLQLLPLLAGFLQKSVSPALAALGLLLLPLALTGGIHVDGFMDTCDALGSHADREKKLAIMKDSHTGAFAVLGCGLYLLVSFVLLQELCRALLQISAAGALNPAESAPMPLPGFRSLLPFYALFVQSRLLSAFAVAVFPIDKDSGLVHTFASASDRRLTAVCCFLCFLALAVALVLLCRWQGLLVILSALVCFLCYFVTAKRAFGGITGDTAGCFVCLCELFGTAAAVLSFGAF